MSHLEKGPRLAIESLNKSGIHIIILKHHSRTHLDGTATCLKDGTPVIALTLRHDRLDNFWFCLLHELIHVWKHFKNEENNFFIDDLDVEGSDLETQTDNLTRDTLIPKKEWDKENDNFNNSYDVINFANKHKINHAIVAGRIRWKKNNYRIFSRLVGHGEVRKFFSSYAH